MCPNIAPKRPVKATIQAVNSGIPPISFEISIAIGAVTDFGIKEEINLISEWKILPITIAERIAIIDALIKPINKALLFFDIRFKRHNYVLIKNLLYIIHFVFQD